MGYLIAMTLFSAVIPLTLLGFGAWMYLSPPGDIGGIAGYRTSMSEKNALTWAFAHRFCGRLWAICGIASLPASLLAMLLLHGGTKDSAGTVLLILCGIQGALLLVTIAATEIALRRRFDKNGNPK